MDKFTSPGFVFCPCKPHQKGNGYHIICCGASSIVYVWYIFEVRDNPVPMRRPEFETSINIKTIGLILILTIDLWNTDKPVIIYIGFYVLKEILEMSNRGIYVSALVKNRCYWTKGVHGDGINKYFSNKYFSLKILVM